MSFIGSKLGSNINLTGSGDRLVSAVNNDVEKWFVDKDGNTADTPGINVKQFGAVGDGLTDDQAAIQAALDSVPTADSEEWSKCTVYVPPGKYLLGKPLKIHKTTRLQGAGPTTTMFVNDFNVIPLIGHLWQGALIDIQDEGSGSGITTGASLVSGPGASMRIDTTTMTPIYLAPTNDVSSALDFNYNTDGSQGNGTDWTIELWFKIDATGDGLSIGSPGGLIASLGTVPDSTFNTNMFNIAIAKTAAHTYQLNYSMQFDTGLVGGTASPILTDGTVYHVALVYYATANTLTLYIDGVGTSSSVTSGSHVVQHPFETIQFGDKLCVFYPDGDTNASSFRGWIDGIRISSKAQYTSNFTTPSSKFTAPGTDHLVKFILNFDQFYGKSVIADGWQYGPYASPFKYYLRPRGNAVATPVGHMDLRDFGTNSGGGTSISMSACPQSVFYNLRLENANRGISINDGSFILSMDRIRIELGVGNYVWDSKSVSGRESVLSNGAVGFAEFSNFYTAGGVVGFSIVRPGLRITNWDQLGSDALIYGLIAQHADEFDDLVIDGGAIDLETATGAALKAVIKLAGVRNASIANYGFSGNPPDLHAVHCLEVLPTTSPPTGSADTISLRACTFLPNTGNTLIQINGSGVPNITLDNCRTLYGVANTLTNKPHCIAALGGQWGQVGGVTAAGNVLIGVDAGAGYPGLWLYSTNVNTPSVFNYALLSTGGNDTILNAPSGPLHLRVGNVTYAGVKADPDGSSAVSVFTDSPAYTTNGAKLLSIRNNAVEKAHVDLDGSYVTSGFINATTDITRPGNVGYGVALGCPGGGLTAIWFQRGGSAWSGSNYNIGSFNDGTVHIQSTVNSGGGPTTIINNSATLTGGSDLLLSVRNNSVEKVSIDKDGNIFGGNIVAGSIQGGPITVSGGIIQTSSSTAMVLKADPVLGVPFTLSKATALSGDFLHLDNGTGNTILSVAVGGGSLTAINFPSGSSISDDGSDGLIFNFADTMNANGDFFPTNDLTSDLGAVSHGWNQLFVDTILANVFQSLALGGPDRIDISTQHTHFATGTNGVFSMTPGITSGSSQTALNLQTSAALSGSDNYFTIKANTTNILTLDGNGLLSVPGGASLGNLGHLQAQYIDGNPGIIIAGTGNMSMNTTAGSVGFQSPTNVNVSSTAATGAGNVAFFIDTTVNWTTTGAKLLSVRNNTVEKLFVDKDGGLNSQAGLTSVGDIKTTTGVFDSTAGLINSAGGQLGIATTLANTLGLVGVFFEVDKSGGGAFTVVNYAMQLDAGGIIRWGVDGLTGAMFQGFTTQSSATPTINTSAARISITSGSTITITLAGVATGDVFVPVVEALGSGPTRVQTCVCSTNTITITMDAATTAGTTTVAGFLIKKTI